MAECENRNEQFEKISEKKQDRIAHGIPVFSIDTKKNENSLVLLGGMGKFFVAKLQRQRIMIFHHLQMERLSHGVFLT